jgi:hypothetical protein
MAVPYTFGSATTSIPLSQLDSNFATTITLGNTAIQLGNTVTTLNNMTLANVTISSGTSNLAATAITNGTSNVTIASSGGNIAMATNGTTAVTIDTSQNVGIGTTSPTQKLTVSGSSSLGTASTSGNTQIFQSPGSLFLTMNTNGTLSGARRNWAISPESQAAGALCFECGTSEGAVPSSPKLIIRQQGAVVLSGGSTSADGTGITFPATQSASSDANTLDDYEEGTWTPTASPSSGSYNGLTTGGWYVKVGRSVTVFAYWNLTASGSAGGNWSLGGLPFTILNTGTYGGGSRGALMAGREDAATGLMYQMFWNNNSTSGQMQNYSGTNPLWITGYVYIMSGTYETT